MKHIFLVNSFSLKDKTSLMINKINAYAIKNKLDFLIEVNDINNSTEDIIKKYKRKDYIIYAIGGDGVINRVLNSLIGTKNILGFIPCGTGNDLYSSVKESFENGIHEVDTIKINDMYFINVACFGIDADIGNNEEIVHSRFIPKSQRYNAALVHHFSHFKPRHFKIKVDGLELEDDYSTICVSLTITLDLNRPYIYNFKARNSMVGLVQLVRALVCGTRNHGFESHIPPQFLHFRAPLTGV